jgi:AcrR family transcriptional regulator
MYDARMVNSAPITATPRARRTQEERSTAMRERLLDATVSCLVEYGYSGTTVSRIAERAGVTRGAQVHHYRTKEDLVVAAIRHLAEELAAQVILEAPRLASSHDPVDAALDILWKLHRGPIFAATVELWVAARTDPELANQVREVEPIVLRGLGSLEGTGLEQYVADGDAVNAVFTAMDTIRGLLISTWHLSPRQVEARWHRAKEQLRRIYTVPA